ncbi:serine/threonine-protein kinase/endoribonuclease IRE1 isoform X1 [Salmo trutta]|uniref:serine/threonine-protein kinase/endoribonuclease IRE1 isoform X1 n=1 Tax=Salmo trutta TaxID=8032 RepID=UPI001131012F|nr:serine/threonine-protein kinase/endoribonuclease IRE1-like isoform X1 [Salmo trutta]
MAVPELLLATLDDLGKEELKEFKWRLRQGVEGFPQRIPMSQLEYAGREDTISKMVETYQPENAVKITLEILRKMNQNKLAETLNDKYGTDGALGDGFKMGASSSGRSTGHFQPEGFNIASSSESTSLEGHALPPASNTSPGTGRQSAELDTKSNKDVMLTYDLNQILGHGADGTIVYKGTFCDRSVAVKRIHVNFLKLAEREVQLLLEVDSHVNVVRYFWTGRDGQHQNIAIELCAASLKEYVKDNFNRHGLQPVEVLKQTMRGLAHLHSLKIVHRDVKPNNILFSIPDHHGQVIVKITDFGMAKKLEMGRQSYSMSSGAMGTVGWNAPELLKKDSKNNPTSAVDIFSAGCVFYYVLTGGEHPFGDMEDEFNVAINIRQGQFSLVGLQGDKHEDIVAEHLIKYMVTKEHQRRPSAETVLNHPFFWSLEQQLKFLKDVSDWIDAQSKLKRLDDSIINQLESEAENVVKGNWMEHITKDLQENLEKRKGAYKEVSVVSLLRAIRNKSNHYDEIPDLHETLGSIPEGFMLYFTSRFPHLLLHTYLAMRTCAEELTFQKYYSKLREAWMVYDTSTA